MSSTSGSLTPAARGLADGGHSTGLGEQGGFAPELTAPEEVLAFLVDAIRDAGYSPGTDGVALALDPAANGFCHDGGYHLGGDVLEAAALIDRYAAMVAAYPVVSIEDGLAETDLDGGAS
jgi:enolase